MISFKVGSSFKHNVPKKTPKMVVQTLGISWILLMVNRKQRTFHWMWSSFSMWWKWICSYAIEKWFRKEYTNFFLTCFFAYQILWNNWQVEKYRPLQHWNQIVEKWSLPSKKNLKKLRCHSSEENLGKHNSLVVTSWLSSEKKNRYLNTRICETP